jgi:hypothetical protein
MIMRYHWGLGVGHVYSRGQQLTEIHVSQRVATSTAGDTPSADDPESEEAPDHQDDFESDSDIENPELSFKNAEEDLGEAEEESREEESDDDLLDLVVMYGETVVNDGWLDD